MNMIVDALSRWEIPMLFGSGSNFSTSHAYIITQTKTFKFVFAKYWFFSFFLILQWRDFFPVSKKQTFIHVSTHWASDIFEIRSIGWAISENIRRNSHALGHCIKGVVVADFPVFRCGFWLNWQSWNSQNFLNVKNNCSQSFSEFQ